MWSVRALITFWLRAIVVMPTVAYQGYLLGGAAREHPGSPLTPLNFQVAPQFDRTATNDFCMRCSDQKQSWASERKTVDGVLTPSSRSC